MRHPGRTTSTLRPCLSSRYAQACPFRLPAARSVVAVPCRAPHFASHILFEPLCHIRTSKTARAFENVLAAEPKRHNVLVGKAHVPLSAIGANIPRWNAGMAMRHSSILYSATKARQCSLQRTQIVRHFTELLDDLRIAEVAGGRISCSAECHRANMSR